MFGGQVKCFAHDLVYCLTFERSRPDVSDSVGSKLSWMRAFDLGRSICDDDENVFDFGRTGQDLHPATGKVSLSVSTFCDKSERNKDHTDRFLPALSTANHLHPRQSYQ